MIKAPPLAASADLRLQRGLVRVGGAWLVILPLLRPLIWSGEATDLGNLFYLVLLAAALATGLLCRGFAAEPSVSGAGSPWFRLQPAWLGAAVLIVAAWGCWRSPLPAAAWALWAAWVLHLGAAWALWPVIRARPGLLVAGLLGGLAGELLVLVGQGVWERAALQRAFRDDPNLVGRDDLREQFAVRVASWRLEGSFLLANTLAAYLITLWPLLADLAWRSRGVARWTAGTLLALASVALACSGSKAGILALLVALAVTGVLLIPAWRWRAAIVTGLLAICAVAALVPWVRTHAVASADVRLGYWQAAGAMIAERPWCGFGVNGFETAFPRLKPAWVEDTIFAHQETLQAAADLGVPVALVLLAWWAVLLVRLRPGAAREIRAGASPEDTGPAAPQSFAGEGQLGGRADAAETLGALGAGIAALALVVVGLGQLGSGFASYPLGDLPRVRLGWAAGFVVLVAAALLAVRRLPTPRPAACFAGVLACLLHAQADFHLHSAQVVGVLALVAMLGLAQQRGAQVVWPTSPRRQTIGALAGLSVLIAVLAGVVLSSQRGELLREGRGLAEALRRYSQAATSEQRAAAQQYLDIALERAGQPPARSVRDEQVAVVALATMGALIAEGGRFPADRDVDHEAAAIAVHLAGLDPRQLDAVGPFLEVLAARWPGELLYVQALGEQRRRIAERARQRGQGGMQAAQEAQALAARVVALYPTRLSLREDLIAAARLAGDEATAQREIAAIRALTPLVWPPNRAKRDW